MSNTTATVGTDLVKELFASRARLDGKLQLRVHGGDADINLKNTQKR